MLNRGLKNRICSILFLVSTTAVLYSQETKTKFERESKLQIKLGCVVNETNTQIINSLNDVNPDWYSFTAAKSHAFNPSFDIEFDNRFSKYVGFNVNIGFMQTRQNYTYRYLLLQGNDLKTNGLILCNIPHVNVSPSFYIKNTRLNLGVGYYKYYYTFNPVGLPYFNFNLNSEGYAIYSNIGVTQIVELGRLDLLVSANCFGVLKSYDRGYQLSVGLSF